MKPTLPTVCRRYEKIRAPVFHLPVIRHTIAERSIRFCLINLLNKDTRSTMIMERVDTDPHPTFKFYMKEQIFDSYQMECIIINWHICLKLMNCSWMILNGVGNYDILVLFTCIMLFVFYVIRSSLYSQSMFTHCSLCTVCIKMTFNKILIVFYHFRWPHDSD